MLNEVDIENIKQIAVEAGKAVLKVYKTNFEVHQKEDSSPLTEADKISHEIIKTALGKISPKIPILSEEEKAVSYDLRKNWDYYWCVDPIDGTKEFIKRNGEFTINIALIQKNTAVLGVVYAPSLGDIYYAKKNIGAFKNGHKLPLHLNKNPEEKMRVIVSKSHLSKETQNFIKSLKTKKIETVSIGSSLKLCLVAEGAADIYPRLSPTMEWDTAAAHAIVSESGKRVLQYGTESELSYNKEKLLNPYFIAKG